MIARLAALVVVAAVLSSCAPPPRPAGVDSSILSQVRPETRIPPPSKAVEKGLLPPLNMPVPPLPGRAAEQRFDLSVHNAPAAQVFMSLVSGTPYSMLVQPEVKGSISVTLKDVTIREALDAIRETYGYDYRIQGTRIFIRPAGLQTRVFQINYLPGQRRGMSEVRVESGAVSDVAQTPATPGTLPGATPTSRSLESARVVTEQVSDFWSELRTALVTIVGTGGGRSVVVTPASGVAVVRAFPSELHAVENYLRVTQGSLDRQVMLEAKIVQVTLSKEYQSGINWAAFRTTGPNAAVGQLGSIADTAVGTRGQALLSGGLGVDTSAATAAATAGSFAASNPAGAVFGLALQTSNFGALLTFLQSQGNVQVLSSPRIATINNQKALLKVGTDEFFVTNVTTTSTTTGVSTIQSPSVTVQPFFSGIVLDVTPQIDATGDVILHIHPSVSEVTESTRVVNLGAQIAEIRLPLAKSTVNETDTIVRVSNGNIVAIGGLMSVNIRDNRGGLPGAPDALRSADSSVSKSELVILLRPTVIESPRDWARDVSDTRDRLEGMHLHDTSP